MNRGKTYTEAAAKVDRTKHYLLDDGLDILHSFKAAKFDETVELAVRLGVDPRHADQMVRSTVVLPHGTGRTMRVLVFAKGENEKVALEAGADYVGAEDLAEKIKGGWVDFDVAIATPDMMKVVGRLGKILGPRGIMPSPKAGTVTMEVAKAVQEAKAGKIEFRVDKTGNVQVPVGKKSFDIKNLKDNVMAMMDALMRAKPAAAKGTYVKSVTLSTTMSPGIKVDKTSLIQSLAR